jgi:hypothetical protein
MRGLILLLLVGGTLLTGCQFWRQPDPALADGSTNGVPLDRGGRSTGGTGPGGSTIGGTGSAPDR